MLIFHFQQTEFVNIICKIVNYKIYRLRISVYESYLYKANVNITSVVEQWSIVVCIISCLLWELYIFALQGIIPV